MAGSGVLNIAQAKAVVLRVCLGGDEFVASFLQSAAAAVAEIEDEQVRVDRRTYMDIAVLWIGYRHAALYGVVHGIAEYADQICDADEREQPAVQDCHTGDFLLLAAKDFFAQQDVHNLIPCFYDGFKGMDVPENAADVRMQVVGGRASFQIEKQVFHVMVVAPQGVNAVLFD